MSEQRQQLDLFEGQQVVEARIEIPKTVMLSNQMRLGDHTEVMLNLVCVKVRVEPLEKDRPDGVLRRIQTMKVVVE